MITLVIGQNATGKSVYIKNRAKKALECNKSVLTNFWDKSYLKNTEYNEERLDILSDFFDTEEIIANIDRLQIISDFEIGNNFNDMITLLCKKGNELYLDEPEYGLYNHEVGYLVEFISRIAGTYENIEIVTHSELFLAILQADRKQIELNGKKQYVLTDLRGSDYETID